jgi:hypothetical protein
VHTASVSRQPYIRHAWYIKLFSGSAPDQGEAGADGTAPCP